MTTTREEKARQIQERARKLSNDYATALQEVQDAWPASRAVDLRASCDGADGERTTIHVDLAATQALVAGRASTNLDDDEIALVVVGLNRIARARSTQVHNREDVESAIALLDKLGFPFAEDKTSPGGECVITGGIPTGSPVIDASLCGASEVLPEGETEHPVPNDDGTQKEEA